MNILQMKKYYPSNQRRVIETAKFAYSPLSKAFERQIIATEHQGEKQKRAVEDHGKQLVESNELIKEDFNIGRGNIPLEEQNKIFNDFVKKKSSEFRSLEKRISADNLIYKYKIEGRSLKDFRNYQKSDRVI